MNNSTKTEPTVLYCENHPQTETTLRCSRCEKPICAKCAVLTPTGYKCKECVHSQQKVFDTAQWYDYPLVFGVAVILSYIASLICNRLGFFTILIAPVAGTVIAEAVRAVLRRRRSNKLFRLAAAAVVIGGLPIILQYLAILLTTGGMGVVLGMIWVGVYIVLATPTAYYRLAGIQIRR
jgi:hypothetical protein